MPQARGGGGKLVGGYACTLCTQIHPCPAYHQDKDKDKDREKKREKDKEKVGTPGLV